MKIVCPNCGTSYDVDGATLGSAGRTVRCVRCRETWLARVDDMARADALSEAADEIGWGNAASPEPAEARPDVEIIEHELPQVESPPLAHDELASQDWTVAAQEDAAAVRPAAARRGTSRKFAFGSGPARSLSFGFNAPLAIAAMAALVLALVVWRNDVVRLLPQTAAFFQAAGLGVNLRDLAFEDVRVTTEVVGGSKVFVIEGAIRPTSGKIVEVPRLRFVVQDARGADIYAWNAVVDQAVVKPGEKVAFRTRLASPPAEAHSVVVRFFHRRDLTSGSV
jgi:predicted Zn finger-like uncharacterized protein